MTVAPVSVVIPTIGRPALLANALASLAACRPAPAEVLIVDQSASDGSKRVVERSGLSNARVIDSRGRGRGLACNEGLREAAFGVVLFVDDDCTVREDWIEIAESAMAEAPGGMITGRFLPAGDEPWRVPSPSLLEEPRDYTGTISCGALYAGNMACARDALLDFGGFDERIVPAAEDCDLCYRWLRDGRRLRHVPELVVWHWDWRTDEELDKLHVSYCRGQGMFYAKHLLARDPTVLRFMALDLYGAVRALVPGLSPVPPYADVARGVFRGLPRGLWQGWQAFRPAARRHGASRAGGA